MIKKNIVVSIPDVHGEEDAMKLYSTTSTHVHFEAPSGKNNVYLQDVKEAVSAIEHFIKERGLTNVTKNDNLVEQLQPNVSDGLSKVGTEDSYLGDFTVT